MERDDFIDRNKISNEISLIKSKYFEKDPILGKPFDKESVFVSVAETLPSAFLNYVDTIVVGKFDFLEERELDALYLDGAIYISNLPKESFEDLVDDIVHETAHAVEQNNESLIYADGEIEREFLSKRSRVYHLLKENGFKKEVEFYDFRNVEYDDQLDMFLYQEVSYHLLGVLTASLFCSPYGITSLKEYFANCFEHYFYASSPHTVREISPAVTKKIEELLENNEHYTYN